MKFFRPTPLYKEYMILDLIEKNSNITQRELSQIIGSSVSMINTYIESYEKKGFITRYYISNKNIEYKITSKGIERKKLLNIQYLNDSHSIYSSARVNISNFLLQLVNKGFKNILLYGAGEVAELLLIVLNTDKNIPLRVLAIIDDDEFKQNKLIMGYHIISSHKINNIKHDGILISSYMHRELIYNKLMFIGYSAKNILMFFDV